MDGDRDDGGPDNTLGPSESLDSDEVRNDDGDTVVDPPDEWIEADEDETLDERLAAEVPDVLPLANRRTGPPGGRSGRSTELPRTATRSTPSSKKNQKTSPTTSDPL